MSSTYGKYKGVCVSTITTTSFNNEGLVILKLAAKLDTAIYSIWIKPPKTTSGITLFPDGLRCEKGELMYQKRLLPSVPLKTALFMFHAFLRTSPLPVLLVDYSSQDFGIMLLTLIQKTGFVDLFNGVIAGFTMTYDLWEKYIPHQEIHNNNRLSLLAKYYLKKIYEPHCYETTYRLIAIEGLVKNLSNTSEMIMNSTSYKEAFTRAMATPKTQHIYHGLEVLLSAVPETVIKAMATEQLSYPSLEKVFQQSGSLGLKDFLTDKWNLHPLFFADDSKILRSIVQYFEKKQNSHFSSDNEPTWAQDVAMDEPISSPINLDSDFAQEINLPIKGEVVADRHQRHQDRLEQGQRDRQFIQEWNQTFDPFY